jgi:hypothetical protein
MLEKYPTLLEGLMSLDLLNTFATCGTLLVISATAIAAIVQLRHASSSNQIAAFNELRGTTESAGLQRAQDFVGKELAEKVKDPSFRYQILNRFPRTGEESITKIYTVGNFYESMGALVKARLVEPDLVLEIWSYNVVLYWERLAAITAIVRRRDGPGVWENFEYLTVLSQDWIAAHPDGTYPPRLRRIELKDDLLEADTKYAASLAT